MKFSKKSLLFMICGLFETRLLATTYNGQFRVGGLNSTVEYIEPIQLEESNDVSVISTRLLMEGDRFFSRRDSIIFDIRDKYDFFGRTNNETVSLEAENSVQIRQAAYRKPWELNRSYYSLGRFSLPEAGVVSNDGFEYGYRFSRRLRLGVFAGIAPEDVVSPVTYTPEVRGFDGNQGGAYAVYKSEDMLRMRTTYMTNGIAQVPSFELSNFVNKVFFYHQGVFNFGFKSRLSSFINFDILPENTLRRLHLTYGYFGSRYRVKTSIHQITPEEYRLKKDIDDELEPSALSTVALSVKYRLSSTLNLSASADYSTRSVDGLTRTKVMTGATYRGLLSRRMSMGVFAGQRKNYLSEETIMKVATFMYFRSFNMGASYISEVETFEDNTTFEPVTMKIDLGFNISKKFRGTFSYLSAETIDSVITTTLFSMGYQFGTEGTSPTKRRTSTFEEL